MALPIRQGRDPLTIRQIPGGYKEMIEKLKDETIIGDLLRAHEKQIKELETQITVLKNKLWLVAKQLEDVTVPKDSLPKLWWLRVDELKPPGAKRQW